MEIERHRLGSRKGTEMDNCHNKCESTCASFPYSDGSLCLTQSAFFFPAKEISRAVLPGAKHNCLTSSQWGRQGSFDCRAKTWNLNLTVHVRVSSWF